MDVNLKHGGNVRKGGPPNRLAYPHPSLSIDHDDATRHRCGQPSSKNLLPMIRVAITDPAMRTYREGQTSVRSVVKKISASEIVPSITFLALLDDQLDADRQIASLRA
jgi:hypothetical protein